MAAKLVDKTKSRSKEDLTRTMEACPSWGKFSKLTVRKSVELYLCVIRIFTAET
jgi:hypothetical protein